MIAYAPTSTQIARLTEIAKRNSHAIGLNRRFGAVLAFFLLLVFFAVVLRAIAVSLHERASRASLTRPQNSFRFSASRSEK